MMHVEDPLQELLLPDTEEPQDLSEARLGFARAVFPLAALLPIFGLCFGDLPSIAGYTPTKVYLGLMIALAIVLISVETVFTGCIPRLAMTRFKVFLPIFIASFLSIAAARLTRLELPIDQVVWTVVCQLALAFWLVYLSYLPRITEAVGWMILIVSILISLLFFRTWYAEGRPYPYAGWAVHKNAMGVAMMCMGAISIAVRDRLGPFSPKNTASSLSVVFSVFVLLICGARSALLVLLATIAFTILYSCLNSRGVSRIVASVILAVSILFPIVYVNLEGTRLGEQVSGMSLDVTGQDVYNGRQKLWSVLLEETWERPVFGYARQVAFERDEDIPMNAHNLFLASLYQSGILGALALVFLLRFFWLDFEELGLSNRHWVPLAFLSAVLIRQMLESELSGENYTSMFAIWSALLLMGGSPPLEVDHEES